MDNALTVSNRSSYPHENDLLAEERFTSIIEKRLRMRHLMESQKIRALKLTQQIPMQLLAQEWFNKIDPTTEMRAYLIENFLPILVLGCEKVLNEAQSRHLIDKNLKDENFNPINHLGQYLLRNNPKYNNQNETSPYVKTVREFYQELKDQIFYIQGNRLAKVKEDVRKRRDERNKIENIKTMEIMRRKLQIQKLYDRFNLTETGRIQTSVIIELLKIFKNQIAYYPEEIRETLNINLQLPKFCYTNDGINLEKRLVKSEFIECVYTLGENLTNEIFDIFIELLEECTTYMTNLVKTKNLNNIIRLLVNLIDNTKTGLISRRRIIQIFKEFSDKNKNIILNDPTEWSVQDPILKFENKIQFATKSEKQISRSNEPIQIDFSDDQPEFIQETTSSILSNTNEIKKSIDFEEGKVTDTDTAENVENTSAENVISTVPPVKKSYLSKPSIQQSKYSLNDDDEIKPDIKRENELLFIKGGSMYYDPMNEPRNSFDASLLMNETKSSSQRDEIQYKYDYKFLNADQLCNLINNFINRYFLSSDLYVNYLISTLKENYSEMPFERHEKMQKLKLEKDLETKFSKYMQCFEKIDNEGSGELNLNTIIKSLEQFKGGLFKEQISIAFESINLKKPKTERINKQEFVDLIKILNEHVNFPAFEDQLISYLSELNEYENDEKSRGENRKSWLKQIQFVGDVSYGSFEPLYKQLFLTLLKDAENYGNAKNISAYVGILEKNEDKSIFLRYHASTPNDSKHILGKILSRETNNISFNVIDSGLFQLIRSVRSNPNVHFFNSDNSNDGSLVVYPLKFQGNKVFGIIGIDTLQETENNESFNDDEIEFYQGVASTFANSYTNLIYKNRLIKCCNNAAEWLFKKPKIQIESVNVYFVQTLAKSADVEPNLLNINKSELHKITDTNSNDKSNQINIKQIMKYSFKDKNFNNTLKEEDKNFENFPGSKLYECAILSEITKSYLNGKISYFVPLRDQLNKAIFVLEIVLNDNIDQETNKIIETVIYILYKCQENLIYDHFFGSTDNKFEYEILYEEEKFAILFEKCFIIHVIDLLSKFKNQKLTLPFAEEDDKHPMVEKIVDFVSNLINDPEFKESHTLSEKSIETMTQFDPTSEEFNSLINQFESVSFSDLKTVYGLLSDSHDQFKLLIEWIQLNMELRTRQTKP